MATHFSILAWEISWTEKPGGLQSTGWQSQTRHLAIENNDKNKLFLNGSTALITLLYICRLYNPMVILGTINECLNFLNK